MASAAVSADLRIAVAVAEVKALLAVAADAEAAVRLSVVDVVAVASGPAATGCAACSLVEQLAAGRQAALMIVLDLASSLAVIAGVEDLVEGTVVGR